MSLWDRIKCPQFRNRGVISIHFFVVSVGDLAPDLNTEVSARLACVAGGISLANGVLAVEQLSLSNSSRAVRRSSLRLRSKQKHSSAKFRQLRRLPQDKS